METKKIIDYEFAKLEYDAGENILFFRVKQDIEVDVREIKEMLRYAEEVMGPKRHFAVIDFGVSFLSTSEARSLYAQSPYIQKYRIADAFIVRSLPLRIVANFFINVTRPKVKTRLFTDETLAIEWLKKIRESNTLEVSK